jgi:hypothetical protein
MSRLREAPSRDQAQQIQRRIEEGNTERGRELRDAGNLKWEGFVDWGVPGEDGGRDTRGVNEESSFLISEVERRGKVGLWDDWK